MAELCSKNGFSSHLEKVIFGLFGCFARPLGARYFPFKSKKNGADDNKTSVFVPKMKDMNLSFHFQCFEDILND